MQLLHASMQQITRCVIDALLERLYFHLGYNVAGHHGALIKVSAIELMP